MKYFYLFFIMFLVGCGSQQRRGNDDVPTYTGEKISDIKENILETAKSSQQSVAEAKTSADIIKKESYQADLEISTRNDIPDTIKKSVSIVKTEADKIHQNLDNIDNKAKEIIKSADKLTAANNSVQKLENTIKSLQEENDKIKQDAVKKLYSYLGIIFFIGTVVVLVGVALSFFYSKKVGITIASMGVVALCLAAGATFYLKYLALIGAIVLGVSIIGTLVYLVYTTIVENKKKNDLEQATEENVELLEVVKQELPIDKKIEIFGDRAKPGIAHTIQTEKTKKKVLEIRENKLKKKIAPTIPRS
jgi:hypothetical protein